MSPFLRVMRSSAWRDVNRSARPARQIFQTRRSGGNGAPRFDGAPQSGAHTVDSAAYANRTLDHGDSRTPPSRPYGRPALQADAVEPIGVHSAGSARSAFNVSVRLRAFVFSCFRGRVS